MATRSSRRKKTMSEPEKIVIPEDAFRLYDWIAYRDGNTWYIHKPVFSGSENTMRYVVTKKVSYYQALLDVLARDRKKRRISKVDAIIVSHDIIVGLWLEERISSEQVTSSLIVDELLIIEYLLEKSKRKIVVEPLEDNTFIKSIDRNGNTLSHYESK